MTKDNNSENQEQEIPIGITGISVQGYKSLYEECSIEIRPLTILAGANSSGKSSIMQPLLLMKQTLESTYDPGALKINGPNVKFTLAEQLLSRISETQKIDSLIIKIDLSNEMALMEEFRYIPSVGFEIKKASHKYKQRELQFEKQMEQHQMSEALSKYFTEKTSLGKLLIQKESIPYQNLNWNIYRESCFLKLRCSSKIKWVGKSTQEVILYDSNLDDSGLKFILEFQSTIRGLIHVPGLRDNPERSYPTTAIGQQFPGTFQNKDNAPREQKRCLGNQ